MVVVQLIIKKAHAKHLKPAREYPAGDSYRFKMKPGSNA
jgi:hypothetical protein